MALRHLSDVWHIGESELCVLGHLSLSDAMRLAAADRLYRLAGVRQIRGRTLDVRRSTCIGWLESDRHNSLQTRAASLIRRKGLGDDFPPDWFKVQIIMSKLVSDEEETKVVGDLLRHLSDDWWHLPYTMNDKALCQSLGAVLLGEFRDDLADSMRRKGVCSFMDVPLPVRTDCNEFAEFVFDDDYGPMVAPAFDLVNVAVYVVGFCFHGESRYADVGLCCHNTCFAIVEAQCRCEHFVCYRHSRAGAPRLGGGRMTLCEHCEGPVL